MRDQEKKVFLSRYVMLERQIDRKLRELGRLQMMAGALTVAHNELSGHGVEGKLSESAEMVKGLQEEIYQDVCALVELKGEISRCIDAVEDNTLRLLLQYRYIDGITFEDIAEQMHYSWRWIIKLHGQALQKLEIVHGCSHPAMLH